LARTAATGQPHGRDPIPHEREEFFARVTRFLRRQKDDETEARR
jgi:hypothetical protein